MNWKVPSKTFAMLKPVGENFTLDPRLRQKGKIRRLRGKLGWQGDLDAMRTYRGVATPSR
jgi:hypothetical protein